MKATRDYSLTGEQSQKAIKNGLAEATWYKSPVSRENMKDLMVRKNGPAIFDTILWFGILFITAFTTIYFWGNWWVIFPYMVYAVIYATTSDSRWHESSHGTVFKTDWLNNVLYEIASFMVLRQSSVWRWSHTRHHSDTLVLGRDPEIAVPRPPNFWHIFLNLFAIRSSWAEMKKIFIHASGRIDKNVATFLPPSENGKVIWKARIYLAIFAIVIGASIYFQTILPLMFIGLPTLFGSWLMPFYGMTQHAGLEENVLDHRINCRTVYTNRIHRFLYWNMNYHVEHHMYPMVPYHALPKLHELIKDDCIPPHKSLIHAWMEIIPALRKQAKDPSYFVKREINQKKNNTESAYIHFERNSQDVNDKNFLKVCTTNELPKNEVIRVDYNEDTFAVYRTDKNELYATEGICTHGNTHLAEGLIIDKQIECPKHNGRFDITDGSAKRQPVCVGLASYIVIEDEGVIYIDLNSGKNIRPKEKVYQYKVVSNNNVATYIKELVLEPLEPNSHVNYQPGDYIHLMIPPHQTLLNSIKVDEKFQKNWKDDLAFEQYSSNHSKTQRNYSLASNPSIDKVLKFNIRIALAPKSSGVKAGIGSSYVFSLKEGDTVDLTESHGTFHIKDTENEMVYVGGGAGMAPLRSHISYLFDTLKTKRKVSFWYGARSKSELFYTKHFEELAQKYENFTFHVALSDSGVEDDWQGHKGFIHEILDEHFLSMASQINNKEYYLCGPPAMIKSSLELLEKYKVDSEQVAFDEF